MADDTSSNGPLLAALTEFAGMPDLPEAARDKLALILAALRGEEFEIAPTGVLALKPAALASLIGETDTTLSAWRKKHVGPPFVPLRHGNQTRFLYPVDGLGKWLREWEFHGSYYPDPSVLAAFGLTRRDEQVAA